MGAKGDWDFRISDLVKIHSPHLHVGAPGIFSDRLCSIQILKREWGAESNGKSGQKHR